MNLLEEAKTIAKGAGLAFLGFGASKIFTYIWRLVLARAGTDVYGLFSLGVALLTIAVAVSLLGLANGVERYAAYYYGKNERDKIKGVLTASIKISLAASIVIGALLYVFAGAIARGIFGKPEMEVIIQFMAIALPAATLTEICFSAMKALQQIKYAIITKNVLDSAFKITLAAIPAFLSWGLLGLSAGYAAACFLTVIAFIYFLDRKVFPLFSAKIKSANVTRELLAFSLPLVVVSIASSSFYIIDTLVLGILKSANEVGVYNAASPTATLLLLMPTALLSLFLPVMTAEYAKDKKEKVTAIYRMVSKWVLLANLPVLLGMVLFSRLIVVRFFGADYEAASVPLAILSVGYFTLSFFWTSLYALAMLKKTRQIMLFAIVNIAVNFTLAFLLVPQYGMIGAATSTAVAMAVYGVLLFAATRKYFKASPFDKRLLAFALGFGAIFFVTWLAESVFGFGVAEKLALFFAVVCVYLLAALKFGFIGEVEKELFRKAFRRTGLRGLKEL